MAARLLSVNVGLPRDIAWRGKTVHTAVWKVPVQGRRMVRRLNIDGDGQGDLAGHGGEHRAVFVYQIESYRYWESELRRDDFTYGQFGENFTVDGLYDQEVCIGDRYRVGGVVVRWRACDLIMRLHEEFGLSVSDDTIYRALHKLGFSHLSARPRAYKQDAEAIEAFKKTLPRALPTSARTSRRARR